MVLNSDRNLPSRTVLFWDLFRSHLFKYRVMIGIAMCTSVKLAVVVMLIGLHGHSSEKIPKEELGKLQHSLFSVGCVSFNGTSWGCFFSRSLRFEAGCFMFREAVCCVRIGFVVQTLFSFVLSTTTIFLGHVQRTRLTDIYSSCLEDCYISVTIIWAFIYLPEHQL